MDAATAPVRRPPRELHTEDIGIQQKPTIEDHNDFENVTVAPENVLGSRHLELLAMAEDPVTIRIERSGDKNAPPAIDCWVNGRGAEVLVNGKWVALGYLPVGQILTTKRKYVEVLARAKVDTINTRVEDRESETPKNLIDRNTWSRAPFSVIEDKNPLGAEWLTRLVRFG